jgi:hypothetical protein
VNKKILKAKAEEELRDNFRPIYDRRVSIMESILDLKKKVGQDLTRTRSSLKFERA